MSEFKYGDRVSAEVEIGDRGRGGRVIGILGGKSNDGTRADLHEDDGTWHVVFCDSLRRAEEPWLPKVGERVRVKAGAGFPRAEGCPGTVTRVDEYDGRKRAHLNLELASGEEKWRLWASDLEPVTVQPNAFTDDGAKERREAKLPRAGEQALFANSPKPDPYTTHAAIVGSKADFYEWQRDQNIKHASMLAQAKAELDRPVRFGKMKDRDRYGQRIGGGWDSSDVEDV